MGIKLAELVTDLTVNDQGFRAGITRTRAGLQTIATTMAGVSRQAQYMLLGSLVGIGKFIKDSSDAEEVMSKFGVVFGDNSKKAEEFSNVLSKKVGRSVIDINESMASFQDTFVPLGFAGDKALELSKAVVGLGIDLASFNNKADSEAFADLQSAIVGNHETVRKYGIIITQATLDQELLSLGLAKSAMKATEQQKVMARLSIINKGSTAAIGDAARTLNGFANTMRAVMASTKDVSRALGDIFKPEAKDMLTWLKVALPEMVDWIKVNKGLVLTVTKLGLATMTFVAVIAPLAIALNAILGSMTTMVSLGGSVITMLKGWTAAQVALNVANATGQATSIGSAGGAVAGGMSTGSRFGGALGKAGLAGAAAYAGYSLGTYIDKETGFSDWFAKKVTSIRGLDGSGMNPQLQKTNILLSKQLREQRLNGGMAP